MKEIIERLEAERKKRIWSYEKLAEVAEVAKGNVFKTLTGKSEPAAGTLFKIAEALGFELIMIKKESKDEGVVLFEVDENPVVLPENGKAGKVVIPKARQTGKTQKLKDIAKIDLVKKAKAAPVMQATPIIYTCGCKLEHNLFIRKKGCKILKENH